jgi:hypothetical protein
MARDQPTRAEADLPMSDESAWSGEERQVLESAVRKAPSVHNVRPWSLELEGRTATLRRRSDRALVQHDPHGRDGRISCGAALANLEVAVRAIGWVAEVDRVDGTDVVATVTGVRRQEPTARERMRHEAIDRRTSYRRLFAPEPLPDSVRSALREISASPSVRARWLSGAEEALELARLLEYAARVRHRDRLYQYELDMWTTGAEAEASAGLRWDALGRRGVSAVGLVTSETRLPDEHRLASWIEGESILVLSTPADDASHHYRVGEAAERAWLEAVGMDVVASIMTQPLQLAEVRSALIERLELAGVPQVLMRFGRPAAVKAGSVPEPQS